MRLDLECRQSGMTDSATDGAMACEIHAQFRSGSRQITITSTLATPENARSSPCRRRSHCMRASLSLPSRSTQTRTLAGYAPLSCRRLQRYANQRRMLPLCGEEPTANAADRHEFRDELPNVGQKVLEETPKRICAVSWLFEP